MKTQTWVLRPKKRGLPINLEQFFCLKAPIWDFSVVAFLVFRRVRMLFKNFCQTSHGDPKELLAFKNFSPSKSNVEWRTKIDLQRKSLSFGNKRMVIVLVTVFERSRLEF